jgi:glucosylceramidase
LPPETVTLNLPPKRNRPKQKRWYLLTPSKKFQTMLGIGGALTDAVAETFYKLPKEKQKELLGALLR